MPTTDTLTLRDARPDDLEAIRDLTLAAYEEYATVMTPTAWAGLRDAVQSALARGETAQRIVAERDGRLVGSVMLFPPHLDSYGHVATVSEYPELRLLAVAPEARGQGVGRALTEECIRRARAMEAAELGLHTSGSLRAAIALYEGMGFERVPERDSSRRARSWSWDIGFNSHPDGGDQDRWSWLRWGGPLALDTPMAYIGAPAARHV